jgi:hypothetical protein
MHADEIPCPAAGAGPLFCRWRHADAHGSTTVDRLQVAAIGFRHGLQNAVPNTKLTPTHETIVAGRQAAMSWIDGQGDRAPAA